MPTKKLGKAQAVDAACILFSLNTEPDQVLKMIEQMEKDGFAPLSISRELFCREWYGFVHATIVANLMVHAPNSVLVDYLRTTSALLKTRNIPKDEAKNFVDTHFAPYMELVGKEEQKACPEQFFKAVCNIQSLDAVPPRALAFLSGTMALVMSAVTDKLEQYEILAE